MTQVTPSVLPAESPPTAIERQIAKLEARFAQLKAQVRQAQQLAVMGPAAAVIAHEFSNLLSPVLSYAQYALQEDDAELGKKALRITVQNARVLKAMSERILEVSAAGNTDARVVPLRQAIEGAVEGLCRDFAKDGITFRNEVPEELTVWADPLQLHQVFFNLLLNARDALAPGRSGRLTVGASIEGQTAVVDVRDTGPGIAPEMLGDLFDPFKTTKGEMREGRQRCGGLGLALCRDLVEENSGTIHVSSKPGEGTTFTIVLPAEKPA
jgi:signal transduction histidine kinase